MAPRAPVVLCIGGTDPLCGAGIVADSLHVAELGGWPLAVETASVQQNSRGVRALTAHSAEDVAARVRLALEDGRPDAVKLGLLATAAIADAVRHVLHEAGYAKPVVMDPVLASGGATATSLAKSDVAAALLRWAVMPRVLITPNLNEAERLVDATPRGEGKAEPWSASNDPDADAAALQTRLQMSVLLKGGHRDPPGLDVLSSSGCLTRYPVESPWPHDVHGTGCALASAIAMAAARGAAWEEAVLFAKTWIDDIARDPSRVRCVGRGRHQFVPPAVGAQRSGAEHLKAERPGRQWPG